MLQDSSPGSRVLKKCKYTDDHHLKKSMFTTWEAHCKWSVQYEGPLDVFVFRKVEVHMPKFKMEQSYSLHDLLPDLGVVSVFSNSANLTRMSMNKALKVSEVSLGVMFTVLFLSIWDSHSLRDWTGGKLTSSAQTPGAAQGGDWCGWEWDHCSSWHNNWHCGLLFTTDLQHQQTVLLLHLSWRHQHFAVHGQGDKPHQKLAVMPTLL